MKLYCYGIKNFWQLNIYGWWVQGERHKTSYIWKAHFHESPVVTSIMYLQSYSPLSIVNWEAYSALQSPESLLVEHISDVVRGISV